MVVSSAPVGGVFMKRFLVVCTLALASSSVLGDNFLNIVETCTQITLEKASVSALCAARNGGKYKTAIRLRGVNNHDGVLTVERDSSIPSVFFNTCTNATLDDFGVLTAKCLDNNRRYRTSSLDITRIIKNYNGTLVYPL